MYPRFSDAQATQTRYTAAATGSNTVVVAAPGAGSGIYITGIHVSGTNASTFQIFHTTDSIGNYLAHGDLAANGHFIREYPGLPLAVGENLTVKWTSSAGVKVTIEYVVGTA